MADLHRTARLGALGLALVLTGACSSTGGLGNVLGSVLGGQQQQGQGQVSGTVRGVDARAQQIGIQQSNGQTVALAFDNQTRVVYQNQSYAVTSLDPGDHVTARIQATNNGAYYTDLVQVDQPVQSNGSAGGTSSNVQSLQGSVRQVDQQNGMFTLNLGSGGVVTVSLPYNVSRSDLSRFQSLRAGDTVRLYGVFLNNSRVELRQFY